MKSKYKLLLLLLVAVLITGCAQNTDSTPSHTISSEETNPATDNSAENASS